MGSTSIKYREIRKVLIIGDNRISTSIIESLSKHEYELHQLVSRHASTLTADRVNIYKTSLSDQAATTKVFAETRPDVVISTVSGGSFDTQKQLIDCALATNISRFIPADFGHDSLNPKIQSRLPPSQEKARTIEYLQSLAAEKRISWVALATGCLLDHGLISGNLGFDLKWQSATLHGAGTERFAASSTAWIGGVVLGVIQHWEEVRNQYLYACGLMTSANDLLQSLERESGKKWEAGRADVEECVREAERRIERGFPDAGMFLMERSVLYDESLEAVRPFELQDAKAKLGLSEEKVGGVVHEVLHSHAHGEKGGCGCD